ncbi:MAG: IPT/TIG domain-containing protein [Thermoflexales bacterium]|nr:IPT/TIG domain-containing protein [Thermoflexales bacterium]
MKVPSRLMSLGLAAALMSNLMGWSPVGAASPVSVGDAAGSPTTTQSAVSPPINGADGIHVADVDETLDRQPAEADALVADLAMPGWSTRYGTELGRQLLPARQAPVGFAPLGAEPALTGTWRINNIVSSTTSISAIEYAPDGRLFVGVQNGGLRVWAPNNLGVYGWTSILSSTTGLPSNSITDLALFGGDLWVATNLGVGIYDLFAGTWTRYTVANSPLPSNDIHRLTPIAVASGVDHIWLSTAAGGVKITLTHPWTWQVIDTADGLPNSDIYDIAEFTTLVTTYVYFSNGLEITRWDQASSFTTFSPANTSCGGGLRRATRMLTTSQHDLWFLQEESVPGISPDMPEYWVAAGVCRMYSIGLFSNAVDYYSTLSPGLPSNQATDISEDFAGRVWLSFQGGTGGGAVWDNGTWRMFGTGTSPMQTNQVAQVLAAGEDVWFGHTDRTGFSIYSPNWRRFPFTASSQQPGVLYNEVTRTWAALGSALGYIDSNTWVTTSVSGVNSPIQAIQRGSDGLLWLGTSANGVVGWSPTSTVAFDQASGLPSDNVTALVRDSYGRMWAGTAAGLALRAEGGYWLTYTTQTSPLISDSITALAVDASDRLWIGTLAGLQSYSLVSQGGGWSTYSTTNGLPSNRINALAVQPSGGLWVGGNGGLSYRDPVSLTWTTYTSATGALPGSTVTHVSIDPQGRVWAATTKGIALRQGSSWQHFFPPGTMVESNRITGLAADNARTWVSSSGSTVFSGTIAARGIVTSPIGSVVPTITTFLPAAGSPGQTIIITGSGFDTRGPEFNVLRFCCADGPSGKPAPLAEIQAVGYTTMSVKVPASASTGQLQAEANGLKSGMSAQPFKLKPIISAISPGCVGVGGLLTIDGAGFQDGSAAAYVKVGSGTERIADATDPTQIRTFLRPGDTSGPVVVRLLSGQVATSSMALSVPTLSVVGTRAQQAITGAPLIWGKRTLVTIDARSVGDCQDAVTSATVEWLFSGSKKLAGGSFYNATGQSLPAVGSSNGDGISPFINVVANVDIDDALDLTPTPWQDFQGARITLKRNSVTLTQFNVPATVFRFVDTSAVRRKVRVMNIYASDVPNDSNHDQNIMEGFAALGRMYPQQDAHTTWGSAWWTTQTPVWFSKPFSITISENDGDSRDEVEAYLDPDGSTWAIAAFDANLTGGLSAGGVSNSGWKTVSIDAGKNVAGRYMAHELMHAFGFVSGSAANYENVPIKGGDHHSKYDEGRWDGDGLSWTSDCDNTREFKDALDAQAKPGARVVRLTGSGFKLLLTQSCAIASGSNQTDTAKSVISYAPARRNFNTVLELEDYKNLLAQLCVDYQEPMLPLYVCPGYDPAYLPAGWKPQIGAPERAGPARPAAPMLPVVAVTRTYRLAGKIGATGLVTPSLSFVAVNEGSVTPQEPWGTYHLRVFGPGNGVLHDQAFALPEAALIAHDLADLAQSRGDNHLDEGADGSFTLRVPFPVGATGVDLYHDGVTLWSASPTSIPPTIGSVALSGSVINPDLPMTVTWAAGDADGGPLQFGLDYSADNGATWELVLPYVTQNSASFVPGWLPASNTARIRVRVSDGFNTASAMSAAFTLQKKAPVALIEAPLDGAVVGEGMPLQLIGVGMGQGGYSLPTFQYSWRKAGKLIANSDVASVTLTTVGVHTLTFQVGDGIMTGTRVVSVTVIADYDKDGLTNSWEQAHGFNPLDPADALADPDGDGLINLEEQAAGTDPRNPDTDGDEFSDALELELGTDPLDGSKFPPSVPALNVGSSSMGFVFNAWSPAVDPKSTWVTNQGLGVLTWTLATSDPWIKTNIVSGEAPSLLIVTGSALGMPLGDYTGTVTVTAMGALYSPQTITIKMHVESNVYPTRFLPLIHR